ncbi:MAG: hypothetical protein IBX72_16105 [Nitrospirae bacterium]|nr:hypothetical protein [Nitrospirota bacterium]
MWLENTECPVNSKDIYIEFEKFKSACRELNVDVSNRLIETYERNELLYPVYKIHRPKEYLQGIFEQNHGHGRFKNVIEVPDEYESPLKFEYEELNRWHHPIFPEFDKAFTEGHPLDQAYKRDESFIEKPSKDTYRNWEEYNVVLESTIEETSIKDRKSTARHFYSPWQIYLLEEANRRHTRKINVLIPLGEVEEDILSEQPQKLSLAQWQDHFKTLWEYRFKENLLFRKSLQNIGRNILEGGAAKTFYDNRKRIAKDIYSRHSYELWIDFLRSLSGLYFDCREREKLRFSDCLKSDIRSVIDLLMLGFEKDYRDIINDVGMYLNGRTYFYIPPLERIYPEYESYLKREAKPLLDSILDDYNKEVPNHFKLDKEAINKIIAHAFNSGNETLLVSIIGINKEYFSPSYFGDEGMWAYIRSLAVAAESWVKVFANKTDFRDAIVALASGDFDSCCNQLQTKCGKTNMNVYSHADLQHFLNELQQINLKRGTKNLSWMKFIIRSYLIRNYVVHHTKLAPELFGSTLIELYRSLIFLIFYAWKVK